MRTFKWLVLAVLSSRVVPADTLTVPSDAYPTIQAGIDGAQPGDTVLVLPGVYEVTAPVTFAGKEIVVRSQEGAETTTIRMGDTPDSTDRVSVVVFEEEEGEGAVLEGFRLTGGRGVRWGEEFFQAGGGAGVFCEGDVRPRIKHCHITGNNAIGAGGGMLCVFGAEPTLEDCTIDANTAVFVGGGIACREASPAILRCAIRNNSAGPGDFGQGGGVYCGFFASPTIEDTLFEENEASGGGTGGGGVVCEVNCSPQIRRCTFLRNTSTGGDFGGYGGALSFNQGGDAVVENCLLEENLAGGAGGGIQSWIAGPTIRSTTIRRNVTGSGGGLAVFEQSSPIVDGCVITGNLSLSDFGGGGIKSAGSMGTIVNSTISNNSSPFGGGIQCFQDTSRVENCLLVANTAFFGAAIHLNDASIAVVNCTLADNTAREAEGGGGVLCFQPDGGVARAGLVNTLFWGNSPNDMSGNAEEPVCGELVSCLVGQDPLFVKAGEFDFDRYETKEIAGIEVQFPAFILAMGDYRLQAASPARGAASAERATARDLPGAPRPCGDAPDIGAYEYLDGDCRPSFRRGDPDGNGIGEITDAVVTLSFLFQGGAAPECMDAADTDDNGEIEVTDAVTLLAHLFQGGPAPAPPGLASCGTDPTDSDPWSWCEYGECGENEVPGR